MAGFTGNQARLDSKLNDDSSDYEQPRKGVNPVGFCNPATWYLSCDFFYFALFPFTAVAYGRHKV